MRGPLVGQCSHEAAEVAGSAACQTGAVAAKYEVGFVMRHSISTGICLSVSRVSYRSKATTDPADEEM